MEPPKNPFTKSFLRKNSKTGDIVSSDFKLFYKATVSKQHDILSFTFMIFYYFNLVYKALCELYL